MTDDQRNAGDPEPPGKMTNVTGDPEPPGIEEADVMAFGDPEPPGVPGATGDPEPPGNA